MSTTITTRFAGTCADCGSALPPGSQARYYGRGTLYGTTCHAQSKTRLGEKTHTNGKRPEPIRPATPHAADRLRPLPRNGKCCGRKPQHYKSKGYLFCFRCDYAYNPNTGENLGAFASGKTRAQRDADLRAEGEAWQARAQSRRRESPTVSFSALSQSLRERLDMLCYMGASVRAAAPVSASDAAVNESGYGPYQSIERLLVEWLPQYRGPKMPGSTIDIPIGVRHLAIARRRFAPAIKSQPITKAGVIQLRKCIANAQMQAKAVEPVTVATGPRSEMTVHPALTEYYLGEIAGGGVKDLSPRQPDNVWYGAWDVVAVATAQHPDHPTGASYCLECGATTRTIDAVSARAQACIDAGVTIKTRHALKEAA